MAAKKSMKERVCLRMAYPLFSDEPRISSRLITNRYKMASTHPSVFAYYE